MQFVAYLQDKTALHFFLIPGVSKFRRQVTVVTKCYTVAPNNISLCPQCETCFTSPFWGREL